jgi:hypothetical protein
MTETRTDIDVVVKDIFVIMRAIQYTNIPGVTSTRPELTALAAIRQDITVLQRMPRYVMTDKPHLTNPMIHRIADYAITSGRFAGPDLDAALRLKNHAVFIKKHRAAIQAAFMTAARDASNV